MKTFEGKRITVAGLGQHGGAVGNIRYLHSQGAKLTVTDLKRREELAPALQQLQGLHGIRYVFGGHEALDFTQTDLVLQNPAMRRDSPYLRQAESAGVPVHIDSSLFLQLSPTKNIIGVTGSKGKSTATHAIAHLLQLKFARVAVIGTEGTSPLAELAHLEAHDCVVFELSSWRLEGLARIKRSPDTAVVTSLYRDHLNTYASYDEYIEAKKNIVRYQGAPDRALLNYDDHAIRAWPKEMRSRVIWFSLGDFIPGDGIYVEHGVVTIATTRGPVSLMPLAAVPGDSLHAKRNILPALYLAFGAGVHVESLKLHLQHLQKLAHRLETVRTLHSVTYINDSAATIPEATIAALESLQQKNIVLILGGSDKRLNFDDLARAITQARIRELIFLPGDATDRMHDVIWANFRTPPIIHRVNTMAEAVRLASRVAAAGDVVLLSPAATSFGLFKHEFDRGNQFKAAVEELSQS